MTQEQRVHRVRKDLKALLVLPDHKGLKAKLERLDRRVRKARLDQLDPKARLDRAVLRVYLGYPSES